MQIVSRARKLVHTKLLYSNSKLIVFWKITRILHDIGLEFCQSTVNSVKRTVTGVYALENKPSSRYSN